MVFAALIFFLGKLKYKSKEKNFPGKKKSIDESNPHMDDYGPGARFSKDPVTYRSQNQMLTSKSQEK